MINHYIKYLKYKKKYLDYKYKYLEGGYNDKILLELNIPQNKKLTYDNCPTLIELLIQLKLQQSVINILEVGAGTGCISEFIYEDIKNAKLDGVQINYYITDYDQDSDVFLKQVITSDENIKIYKFFGVDANNLEKDENICTLINDVDIILSFNPFYYGLQYKYVDQLESASDKVISKNKWSNYKLYENFINSSIQMLKEGGKLLIYGYTPIHLQYVVKNFDTLKNNVSAVKKIIESKRTECEQITVDLSKSIHEHILKEISDMINKMQEYNDANMLDLLKKINKKVVEFMQHITDLYKLLQKNQSYRKIYKQLYYAIKRFEDNKLMLTELDSYNKIIESQTDIECKYYPKYDIFDNNTHTSTSRGRTDFSNNDMCLLKLHGLNVSNVDARSINRYVSCSIEEIEYLNTKNNYSLKIYQSDYPSNWGTCFNRPDTREKDTKQSEVKKFNTVIMFTKENHQNPTNINNVIVFKKN
jgi:SAM-dependent methyltransferase